MSNARKSLVSRLDGITILLYLLLTCIGLIAIFSVEHHSTDLVIFSGEKSYMRQTMWLGVSLLVGAFILLTDSKFFASTAFLSYTFGIVLLVLTIFIGIGVKGSKSWLGVGGIRVQPGEVCKIFTALALSKFLSLQETNFKSTRDRVIGIAMVMFPALIVILQNETGLALVYLCFFLVMYREGLPNVFLVVGISSVALVLGTLLIDRKVLFIILTAITALVGFLIRFELRRNNIARILLISIWGVCIIFSQLAVPFMFKHALKPHHIDRIYSMLGKEVPVEYQRKTEDGEERKGNSSEYNVLQSKIAIGSGGMFGKGLLNGTSTKNQFVPEQNTDFIFTAIAEQFGFAGSFVLIGLYISLMFRIMFIAERQRSPFSRIYAYCVSSILFFHFAVNISMTVGLAPVIGITLPFLSYGGSSLLSFSILIFILLKLDSDRHAMIR